VDVLVCSGGWVLASGDGSQPQDWRCSVDGSGAPWSALVIENNSAFSDLSIADAELLMGSALVIWATAWGARQLLDLLLKPQHRR
jgi:hypothetical protein